MNLLQKTFFASLLFSSFVSAEMVALNDNELGNSTGEGLGFALENFMLDSDSAKLSVTGIQSSSNEEINIDWTGLYIMGEGSENGSIDTPANIGSYLNPYVIRTIRGSKGLDPLNDSYNSRYENISNDLAILELATDSYESDLQNSETFGMFSYYQGCVWGEIGCNSKADVGANGIAVEAITAELNALTGSRNDIAAAYSLDIPTINARIETHYNTQIVAQENVILEQEVEYDQAVQDLNNQYDLLNDAFEYFLTFSPDTDCVVGQSCSSVDGNCSTFACGNVRRDYNDQLDDWEEQQGVKQNEYNDVIAARQELNTRKTDPSRFTIAGVSYIQAVEDMDEFRVLCGYQDDFASCADGLIARKETTKSGVESVSMALFNDGARRKGLDVGSSFKFEVNAVNSDGSSTPRTDFIDINMKGVFIDGSALRLWSATDEEGGNEVNGELRINLFIKELDISVCDPIICDNDAIAREASTLNLDNLFISLNLGYGEIQPLRLSATPDGNFEFELTKLRPQGDGLTESDMLDQDKMQKFYNDYYADAPKSFVSISDVRIGSGPEASVGGITVDGLRAQYLKVTSRDL
jgi:hypothetical protein